MNGRTNSNGVGTDTLQVPLDPPVNLTATAGNAKVSLTWVDPVDKYATPEGETAQDPQQLVSEWDYTVVVRKVGSQPNDPNDGTVVTKSSIRNQYQTSPYEDTGLINDTVYFYGVFAVNKDGVASEGLISEGVTPKLGTPLSELAEGTIIKINENGSPVEFYLAKHNYEPDLNGPGRELVVRVSVDRNMDWYEPDGVYNTFGPSSAVYNYCNGEYYSKFSQYIQDMSPATKYYYTFGGAGDEVNVTESNVFILSATEFGMSGSFTNIEGSELPIASTLTKMNENGESGNAIWTRTPANYNNRDVYVLNSYGGSVTLYEQRCYYSSGVRPCFTLLNEIARVDTSLTLVEE